MRKFAINLAFIIIFFVLLFLQVNIFPLIPIAGIVPNLFVVFVVFIGLFTNTIYGVTYGVIIGIMLDSLYAERIGVTSVMLASIGFLSAYFDKNFSKESKITFILIIVASTIFFELGKYVLTKVFVNYDFEWFQFTKILIIETTYNVLLIVLFYPLIRKLGYSLDRIYKKTNLLTRYF